MNPLAAINLHSIPLSVSYRSSPKFDPSIKPAPDAMIITDILFNIKGLNDTAEKMFGLTIAEALGKSVFAVAEFETIGVTRVEAIQSLQKDGYWSGDILYQYNDGRLIFDVRCTIIKDDTGQPSSIVIMVHNISARLRQEKDQADAALKYQTLVESLFEGVMLVDANMEISAANKKALEIFGLTTSMLKGTHLVSPDWKTIKEDGSIFHPDEYPAVLTLKNGSEKNNVIMGLQRHKGKEIWISINSRPIFNEHSSKPVAAVVSMVDITEVKLVNERLAKSELLFRTFMKNSPTLGWIYDDEGVLVYGNPKFLDIVGLPEGAKGRKIADFTPSAEVSAIILNRNKEVLLNEKPLITEDEFADKNGEVRNYLSYWFLIPLTTSNKLIGGHAVEITDTKKARREIDKMFERYQFAINASSDAIWDMDMTSNTIFRSDAFAVFSGYKKETIEPTLDWFMDKIHPEDKKRITKNIDQCIKNKLTYWDIEYRFKVADGSYRHVLDRANALYENKQLVRVIGAMQDITERKKLEIQLVNEQVQKQKVVNKAIIQAQEKERNRLSGELHDNVNQLLTSAKLHICVAKTRNEGESILLDKANQYLMMAIEEIRSLSKTLNSTATSNTGLIKSVAEIGANLLLTRNIQLHTYISEATVAYLSGDQQMMVYRIIQEQTNNILKYASTKEAIISLKIEEQNCELIISDNGQGFDKNTQKVNGIGFINIFNRVDAYNGTVEIITSPGNGCTLLINFPLPEDMPTS